METFAERTRREMLLRRLRRVMELVRSGMPKNASWELEELAKRIEEGKIRI
jgi:hypothetical protein